MQGPALHAGCRGFESLIAQSRFVGLALIAESPLVFIPIHGAINQAQELRLRQQALPGHRSEEVVGDVADLRGMTGLGSRAGLQTVPSVIDEIVMVSLGPHEALRLQGRLNILPVAWQGPSP
jgi:hypothetical protein